jgi:serine/threonine-protein kinase RsbW
VIASNASPSVIEGAWVRETPPAAAIRDAVRVTLPASGAYLSVLRTATAALASRLDLTLDDIEDLKIAVDEACALLLATAVPGADITCEFELQGGAISVCVSAPTTDGQQPPRDTFAWTVLAALAGEVDSWVDADRQVTVMLRKVRPAGYGAGQP